MTTAVLSIGSNMGDPAGYLREAVTGLGASLQAQSSVYRTPPWGPVAQQDFLNMTVIVADPALDASGWLDLGAALERQANRQRPVRWGPRTLDVDVVAAWEGADRHDDAAAVFSDDPRLILPHPRAAERGFVLVPWLEIDSDAVLPGHGSVAALVAAVDTTGIVRVGPLGG